MFRTATRTLLLSTISSSTKRRTLYSLEAAINLSNCPNCTETLPTSLPTCTKCDFIAPLPSKVNYHSLFRYDGKGEMFGIDEKELRRRFLAAQRVCHPDSWSSKGEKELELASAQSAIINKAYETLKSPRLRGEYILAQNGVHVGEEEHLMDDAELIMQVMDAREELESANEEEKESLLVENKVRMNKAIEDLDEAIASRQWQDAKGALIRLRYWENLDQVGRGTNTH